MPGSLVTTGAVLLVDDQPAAAADAALIEGLRARDPTAVAIAYDRHHQTVRGFARRLLGDQEAAEDLVQDVFVALPEAARRFDQRAALRTFLIGIAINHARHHLRAAARRRRALERMAGETSEPPVLPDEAAERRRLAAALARALDDLPLKQRLVFLLCDLEHRPSAEAATILGIPDATVRTRLHHARERLRAALHQERRW